MTKEWTIEFPDAFFWIGFVVVGVIASVLFYHLHKKEVKARVWILIPFALMTSIICLKSAAGIIVDGIAFTSRVFGVNQVLLGATVLAVGNTLADFYANASLAALGYGVMACTGSLAGQLFNFLIGFGANTLKLTLNRVTCAHQTHVNFKLLDFSVDGPSKTFTWMIIGFVLFYLLFLVAYSYVKE